MRFVLALANLLRNHFKRKTSTLENMNLPNVTLELTHHCATFSLVNKKFESPSYDISDGLFMLQVFFSIIKFDF